MVVDFVDRRFGFVASGPRSIFRTRDGGRRWQRLRFACPYPDYLGGLAFVSRREGFASCGGQPATAMQFRSYHFTHNGGTSWRHLRARIENGHVGLLALPNPRTRYIYASRLGIFRLGGPRLLFIDDTDSVGDELAVPARWLRAPAPARPDPDGRRRPSLATAMSGRIRSSPSRS
jgi:hypothetical protein